MSLTAIAWLLSYIYLAFRGFSRPVYACCAYLLSFYLSPPFWWWGQGVLSSVGVRWNLTSALLVALTIFLNRHRIAPLRSIDKWFMGLLVVYVANAFGVHYLLADYPKESAEQLDLVWKSVGLALLLRFCIWDNNDLRLLLLTILTCSFYIGYEVVFNEAGTVVKGRLEGINFPGAGGSNGAAAILSLSTFFIGYFVICNPFPYSRIFAFLAAPIVLDTLLRCNSRGAYLAMGLGGICLILLARGRSRRYAILIALGGVLAFFLQAQSSNIWERLFSVAATEEERDASADQRLKSWEAGMKMIADYPLGSGGRSAFVSPRGMQYIIHIRQDGFRSVHNGYISIMAGWGVQGFALLISALALSAWNLLQAIRRYTHALPDSHIFLGASILAALVGQAVCAMFGDYLDGEWFIWLAVFSLSFAKISEDEFLELTESSEEESPDETISSTLETTA